jgi:hypothetical protein
MTRRPDGARSRATYPTRPTERKPGDDVKDWLRTDVMW